MPPPLPANKKKQKSFLINKINKSRFSNLEQVPPPRALSFSPATPIPRKSPEGVPIHKHAAHYSQLRPRKEIDNFVNACSDIYETGLPFPSTPAEEGNSKKQPVEQSGDKYSGEKFLADLSSPAVLVCFIAALIFHMEGSETTMTMTTTATMHVAQNSCA